MTVRLDPHRAPAAQDLRPPDSGSTAPATKAPEGHAPIAAHQSLLEKIVEKVVSGEQLLTSGFGKLPGTSSLGALGPAGPAPALKRPVVMITGLLMQANSYDPMAKQLAKNAQNGPVAVYSCIDGQFHLRGLKGPVMNAEQLKNAKIFEVQYVNPKAAPEEKAPQIAEAMRAINGATGAGTVDVVCHSAGCTDFRLYLQDRSEADRKQTSIGEAVLIGPASHGTFMGNVGDVAGGIAGVHDAGKALEIGSPLVDRLNAHWDEQRGQVKGGVTIVAVTGAPTPGAGGIHDGDGFMQEKDTGMPGSRVVDLRSPDFTPVAHLAETGYTGVIGAVQDALRKSEV